MPPNETKEGSIDELIRKRRGGRGKPRLDRNARVLLILKNLPDEFQMTSKVAYHPGLYMNKIVRLFPSPNWTEIPSLIEQLSEAGIVTYREGEEDERPPKYYYRTATAVEVLKNLEKIEELRQGLPF